jgi:hypothetical protein
MMSLSIYIPRILGTVKKKTIYDTFNHMGIGRVTELDMVYKINENHNAYYFAFIKISPYNTPQFTSLQNELNKKKSSQLVYDEEAGQYWEIKKYIPRDQRNIENILMNSLSVFTSSIPSIPSIPSIKCNDPSTKNAPHTESSYSGFFELTTSIWTPITPIIIALTDNTYSSSFSKKDKLDLVEEYEELEREIYNQTLAFI